MPTMRKSAPVESPWFTIWISPPTSPCWLSVKIPSITKPRWLTLEYATSFLMSDRKERARREPVVHHLDQSTDESLLVEREDPEHHEAQMAHAGVRHQFLDVRLDRRHPR